MTIECVLNKNIVRNDGKAIQSTPEVAVEGTFNIMERIQQEQYNPQTEKEEQQEAEKLLEEGKPKAAMEIIEKYRTRFEADDNVSRKWVELFVDAAVAGRTPSKLILLYDVMLIVISIKNRQWTR